MCLEAQLAAVAEIKRRHDGRRGGRVARDVIAAAGYGDSFGHGLGHGVGLRRPRGAAPLARVDRHARRSGNVVTIEPGIYLPGVGGVRIEDLAVVREHGLELLTSFPKDLHTVG